MAEGSGIYWTARVLDAANPTTFKANPTIESADFTYAIMNASGDLIDFGRPDILPVVQPAGSKIIKGELSAVEATAARLAAKPLVEIDLEDNAGAEWNQAGVTLDSEAINGSGNPGLVLDIAEGDVTETSTKLIIKKKGTETVILEKNISGSLLPPTVTVSTSDP